jgi:hypothetical protein
VYRRGPGPAGRSVAGGTRVRPAERAGFPRVAQTVPPLPGRHTVESARCGRSPGRRSGQLCPPLGSDAPRRLEILDRCGDRAPAGVRPIGGGAAHGTRDADASGRALSASHRPLPILERRCSAGTRGGRSSSTPFHVERLARRPRRTTFPVERCSIALLRAAMSVPRASCARATSGLVRLGLRRAVQPSLPRRDVPRGTLRAVAAGGRRGVALPDGARGPTARSTPAGTAVLICRGVTGAPHATSGPAGRGLVTRLGRRTTIRAGSRYGRSVPRPRDGTRRAERSPPSS